MTIYICITDCDDGSKTEAVYTDRTKAKRHPFAIDSATHRVEQWTVGYDIGGGEQVSENILGELDS